MSTALYPQGATLDGKHYTAKQIWIITKIQSHMRMYMAKKRVAMIRHEVYPHGMHDMMNAHQGEDFENINVQVSPAGMAGEFLSLRSAVNFILLSCLRLWPLLAILE